jgi:hypothetical protein
VPISVKVLRNALPGLGAQVRQRAGQISQQSAYRIRDDAVRNIVAMGAVDTGETRDNIEAVKAEAFTWYVLSSRPSSDDQFNVPASIESGTVNTPPRPYLTLAAETERSRFYEDMGRLLDGLV